MANNQVSKSWFAVLANPEDHGYSGTPQEICEKMCDEWLGNSSTRTGAWTYCISAGGLPHVHMVVEDEVAMRFSAVKKAYACGAHFEPTKGNKKQADDYINKSLRYYRDIDGFSKFTNEMLLDYRSFHAILHDFQRFYKLESYTVKEIDQYLWQLGKANFPKKY